jgi:hypothetical protein
MIRLKLVCKQIAEEVTQCAARSACPEALIIVGQQYSGADRLIPRMLENIKWDKPPVVINFADFVCDHPKYLAIMANSGAKLKQRDGNHILGWMTKALDALIERDCGIIHLIDAAEPHVNDTLFDVTTKLRARGYRVTLAVMAVCEKISAMREIADYLHKAEISQPTVPPDVERHINTARNMPSLVAQLEGGYLIDALKVYNHELEEIYSNSLDDLDDILNQSYTALDSAKSAVLREQRRGLTEEETAACLDMLARTVSFVKARQVRRTARATPHHATIRELLVLSAIELFWDDVQHSPREELRRDCCALRELIISSAGPASTREKTARPETI